jgi:hypothetical protein
VYGSVIESAEHAARFVAPRVGPRLTIGWRLAWRVTLLTRRLHFPTIAASSYSEI